MGVKNNLLRAGVFSPFYSVHCVQFLGFLSLWMLLQSGLTLIPKHKEAVPSEHSFQDTRDRKRNPHICTINRFSSGMRHLQVQLVPNSCFSQHLRDDLVSPGRRALTISFLMKLRGFGRQRKGRIGHGTRLLASLRCFSFWILWRCYSHQERKSTRLLKKSTDSPRSQGESRLHCWVSKLLWDREGQRTSLPL